MPSGLRDRIYRSMVHLDPALPEGLVLKVAETPEELEAAFRIVYESYVGQGLMEPNENRMRVTRFHALPTTTTLIACVDGEAVATVSIIKDSELGLPADCVADLNPLRRPGKRIAEISSLAIRKSFRKHHGQLFLLMGKAAWVFSERHLGLDEVLCACHPVYAGFYRSILLFSPLVTEVKADPYVRGAPAVVLHVGIRGLRERYLRQYGDALVTRSVYAFYALTEHRGQLCDPWGEYHKISYPVMDPEKLERFFGATGVFRQFDPATLAFIQAKYAGLPEFEEVFARVRESISHPGVARIVPARALEIDTDLEAKAHLEDPSMECALTVWRVCAQAQGLDLLAHPELRPGRPLSLRVRVAPQQVAHLEGRVERASTDGSVRMEIAASDGVWDEFVAYLREDLRGWRGLGAKAAAAAAPAKARRLSSVG